MAAPVEAGPSPQRYREVAPPQAWRERLTCAWERPSGHVGPVLVLPDGCADVVWGSDGSLFVAGPDLGPVEHEQSPGVSIVGVRLRPGTAASTLGMRLDELRDLRVPLDALWGRAASQLGERIAGCSTTPERMRLLADAIGEHGTAREIDRDVTNVARLLGHGEASARDVAAASSVGERQLRRRFVDQIGYGPKLFDRVMRLQRFIAAARSGPAIDGLAGLAAVAGYADQSHLTRDCRQLAQRTPAQLLRDLAVSRP